MNERVLEIVAYIVNAMQSSLDDALFGHIENLSQVLIEQGYTENEINSAFSWLIEKMPSEAEANLSTESTLPEFADRTWHSFDKSNLSPASNQTPIQLRELDIIGEDEIEQILAQSLKNGRHGISIAEIKALVSSLIFTTDPLIDGSFFVYNKPNQIH